MSSCSIGRHLFVSNKTCKTYLLVEQEDMSPCSFCKKKTCLRVQQEQRRHVVLLHKGTCLLVQCGVIRPTLGVITPACGVICGFIKQLYLRGHILRETPNGCLLELPSRCPYGQDDMSCCSTRRHVFLRGHVFLLNWKTSLCFQQDMQDIFFDIFFCWTRRHVSLFKKKTCLRVQQEQRRHVVLLHKGTCLLVGPTQHGYVNLRVKGEGLRAL